MDTFDQGNLRPIKRRKLDIEQGLEQLTVGDSPFLTLARSRFQVSITNLEKRTNWTEFCSNPAVSIESACVSKDRIYIDISAPWLKGRATVHTTHNQQLYQILEDCTSVDSSTKISNDHLKAVSSCHDAKLYIDDKEADLVVSLLWTDNDQARDKISPLLRDLLHRYVTLYNIASSQPAFEAWNVREFYENVHVPRVTDANTSEIKIDLLHCELYPFQRRAVRWLLSREGVSVTPSGEIEVQHETADEGIQLPTGFFAVKNAEGIPYYVNPAIGVACSSKTKIMDRYKSIRGGLLGEAMGLGKTVEMIALMCLHTMHKSPYPQATQLRKSRATLIITPPAILEQWRQEIQGHAPSLQIYNYSGAKASSKRSRDALIEELCSQDVVLTTYGVIAKELHYVMEKPDRVLRNRPRHEPPKSPLDQILWWRVCLDEAQMIESGVSAAAHVARLIPRVNAWAVTGTPIRQSHRDLYGLLLFLRHQPWCNSTHLWDYLISYHRPMFRGLMNEIAIRHSKELVRDELQLPPQHRHTISVAFTNIEQAHYAQLFFDMYQDLGLNRDGSPANDQWDPESPKAVEKMRIWLTRLRQTCLHPEVGGRNRRALGRHRGPLRTVAQVLDVMIDQTVTTLRSEQRNTLMYKIRQGQISENGKDKDEALRLYFESYTEAIEAANDCQRALDTEVLSHEQATKHKEEKTVEQDRDDDDSDTEDNESPLTTARQRLRSALEVKHMCVFFMANIYFQMKSDEAKVQPDSEEFQTLEKKEVEAYEEAKRIRSELLKEVVRKANRKIAGIKIKDSQIELVTIPQMSLDLDYTGIESRKIFEKLYKFCESMNLQAEQLDGLRQKMVKLLQQSLIDEDEGVELQGDEYENSTKHQDEMYAYMEALRALYADRSDAVSGQDNILIRVEMKNFLKAAKEGEGPAPELMIKLLAEREQRRIVTSEQGSLRGIMAELRALVSSLQWSDAAGHSSRAKAEMHVADQILQYTTKLAAAQNKSLSGLEQEVASFRNIMNARLEYYKSLQKISDTVAPYREEDIGKDLDQDRLQQAIRDEDSARNRFSTALAKSRYLLHLKAESTAEGTERICTICQSEFETGTITSCGHVFCKDDIRLWYREHGNCPICKRRLFYSDFFDITYKPSEMAIQAEGPSSPGVPQSPNERAPLSNSIYSDISERQLSEIKNIDIRGASFGSKVDTICRHLCWLREKDAGCKTLVFTQFREVLDVLGRAFRQNEITYSKCDDKGAIQDFKSNPAIEVFLLHARAYSAGLNLVAASHVILCEPLINTALELQAIARVHRIGQHRQTTVWMYLIADTVEESIYGISVKRRLAHINTHGRVPRSGTQTPVLLQESTIDAANSKELQEADLSKALAPGKNGGEMVDRDDLWPCLFSNQASEKAQPSFLDAPDDAMGANGDIDRFLRGEAAARRRDM